MFEMSNKLSKKPGRIIMPRNVFKVVGTPQRTDMKSLKVMTNRLKDIAKIGKT